jgi:hypothetical protein
MTTPRRNTPSDITITALSTLNDLRHWWETRQADVDSVIAYTDGSPRNFVELLECITSGKYLFHRAKQGDTVVGPMRLHVIIYNPDGTPRAGWLGTYVVRQRVGYDVTLYCLQEKDIACKPVCRAGWKSVLTSAFLSL